MGRDFESMGKWGNGMREILFRGKTDKGEWVEGQLLHFKSSVGAKEFALIVEGCEWDNSNEWFNLGKRAKVIPSTIGQYTGLTDKNGTKIFEGDIVNFKTTAYHFKNCRIEYRNSRAGYCAIDKNGCPYPMDKSFKYEVIGNIHDNLELLGSEVQGE